MKKANLKVSAGQGMSMLREITQKTVDARLSVMDTLRYLETQDNRYELASEAIQDAVSKLYDVESALGTAHNHLLVEDATLNHVCAFERDKK